MTCWQCSLSQKSRTEFENGQCDIHDDDYNGRQSATRTECEHSTSRGNDFEEKEREKLMAHNWRIIHSNEEVEMAFRYWLQMQESYSYRDGTFLPRVRFGVVSVLLAYVEKRQFGGIYKAHFTQ